MTLPPLPWLELALIFPLAGVLAVLASRTAVPASRWCLAGGERVRLAPFQEFALDEATAPMAPVLVLLHLLAALGSSKARVTRSACLRVLASAFVGLAALSASSGGMLILLLAVAALLPAWDMAGRGRPPRAYLIYIVPILALMAVGWGSLQGPDAPTWAVGMLLLGVVLYGGVFPLHGWMPTLFGNAGFGGALLAVLPLLQIVAALRLVLPVAPPELLTAAAFACLFTAVYAGGMAATQRQARRFFAYLCLSQTSLVMFAVLLHTPAGVAAALCLWISAALSLSGLAFSLRALEARFGPLSLREHHGFYEQVPSKALCFLIAGLGCVGFPGAIGFVPMELLISGSFEQGLWVSAALAVAAMLNGVAILRAYFSLFTGKRPTTSVPLRVTTTERVGLVAIVLVMLLGGWFSPHVVASRHAAAEALLAARGETARPAH
jgi:NADH-quinone oxidoreductase subunit M